MIRLTKGISTNCAINKTYRFIAIILVAALLLACASCSVNTSGGKSSSETPKNTTTKNPSDTTISPSDTTSSPPDNTKNDSSEKPGGTVVQASDIVIVTEPEVDLVYLNSYYQSSLDTQIFCEGLMAVNFYGEAYKHNGWGYIDTQGKIAIQPQFSSVSNFSDGLASAAIDNGEGRGYIDKSGKYVIPQQFYSAMPFNEGLAFVVNNHSETSLGLIDKIGNFIVPFERKIDTYWSNRNLFIFSEGLALVRFDGKYGYMDKEGKIVIPVELKSPDYAILHAFHDGRAAFITEDWRLGYMDNNGNIIVEPEENVRYTVKTSQITTYSPVIPEYYSSDGYLWVGDYYIDENQERLIVHDQGREVKYTARSSFSGGIAIVQINGKDVVSIINTDGDVIAEHTVILGFGEGYALFADELESTDLYSSSFAGSHGKFGVLKNAAYQAPSK